MYWSKVGDRKNVQRPISAFASTFGMTASAGSGASGVATADADGDASADPDGSVLGAVDAGGSLAPADGAVDLVAPPQALTANMAARPMANNRLSIFMRVAPPRCVPLARGCSVGGGDRRGAWSGRGSAVTDHLLPEDAAP